MSTIHCLSAVNSTSNLQEQEPSRYFPNPCGLLNNMTFQILFYGSVLTIASIPVSVLGIALLVESVVRLPISLTKECFCLKEDGLQQAFKRFGTAMQTTIPLTNLLYLVVRRSGRNGSDVNPLDFITDPMLRDRIERSEDPNIIRMREEMREVGGDFSYDFYIARPLEIWRGSYNPTRLNALINACKSILI